MAVDDVARLLGEVLRTPPDRRMALRGGVEALGDAAIEPLTRWMLDAELFEFAAFVLAGIAERGSAPRVLANLRAAYGNAPLGSRPAIERLGRRVRDIADQPPPLPPNVWQWVSRMNRSRHRLGQPVLGTDDVQRLTEAWERIESDASAYRNWCWKCRAPILGGMQIRCSECGWYECYCGACASPSHRFCSRGVQRFPDDLANRTGW